MRAYVSGPMSGLPNFNYPAFYEATFELRRRGHFVISPVECAEHLDGTGAEWADYMRVDLPELVQCDTIVLLHGWHRSRGARLEHHIALELGMRVLTLAEALEEDIAA
jgi:hypothetical protein